MEGYDIGDDEMDHENDMGHLERIFAIVHVSGFTVVGLLHMLGFFLVYRVRTNLPNQRLLILNLSMAEMLRSWKQVVWYSLSLAGLKSKIWELACSFICSTFLLGIPLIILHIIVDRFLEIYFNFKYPLIMSCKQLKIIICILWIVSIIFAVVVLINDLINMSEMIWAILDFVGLVLDLVIVVLAFGTYMYFHTKMKRIRQSKSNNVMLTFKFKIPCLMVLSYIFLNVSSTILKAVISLQHTENDEQPNETGNELQKNDSCILLDDIAVLLLVGAYFLDAIIYVFLQKSVRKHLLSLLYRGKETQRDKGDNYMPMVRNIPVVK